MEGEREREQSPQNGINSGEGLLCPPFAMDLFCHPLYTPSSLSFPLRPFDNIPCSASPFTLNHIFPPFHLIIIFNTGSLSLFPSLRPSSYFPQIKSINQSNQTKKKELNSQRTMESYF